MAFQINQSKRKNYYALIIHVRNYTQVEVSDRKSICPDRPRQNMSMSRPPHTERTYVQTFVRSKILMSRLSCVQNHI